MPQTDADGPGMAGDPCPSLKVQPEVGSTPPVIVTLASSSAVSLSALGMRLTSISLMTKLLPSDLRVTSEHTPKLPFPKIFPRTYLSMSALDWICFKGYSQARMVQ